MIENILTEMVGKAVKAIDKYTFRFGEELSLSRKQQLHDEYLLSLPVDPTITSEINHTKFPDETVLLLLEVQGAYFKDIHELESVDAIVIDEPGKFGYEFKITLAAPYNITTIELELNN